MARKRRLEFSDVSYLVTQRARPAQRILGDEGVRGLFETCLSEAATRSGWRVGAWVVGEVDVALALQAPVAHLSAGLQWMLVTFAARVAARKPDAGPVFARRYRSVLVEPGEPFGRVCQAIDLESLISAGSGRSLGSLRHLREWEPRPAWFDPAPALLSAGGWNDTRAGRAAYVGHLGKLLERRLAGEDLGLPGLHSGWLIGGERFREEMKARLLQREAEEPARRRASTPEKDGLWAEQLARWRARLPSRATEDRRVSAIWRAVLAYAMKSRTEASNRWLAEALNLSSPVFVSRQAALIRQGKGGTAASELLRYLQDTPPGAGSADNSAPDPFADDAWRRIEGLS